MEKFIYDPKTMCRVSLKGYWLLGQVAGTEMIKAKNGTAGYKEFSESDSNLDFLTKPYVDWNYGDYKSFHTGVLGEIAYALKSGETPNTAVIAYGDNNSDFTGGLDVKSTWTNKYKNTTDCYLVENCYKQQKNQIAKYYLKVNLDINEECAYLVGWCTGEELCAGEKKNYGKAITKYGDDGERFTLHYSQLKPYYTLPPYLLASVSNLKKEAEETLKSLTDDDDIQIYKAMVNKRIECLKMLYKQNKM